MARIREPVAREAYAGAADVAQWFGVTRATVSNWFARFDNYPQPDVRIGLGRRARAYGWLPSRRGEWETWHAENVRPQRADDIERKLASAELDARDAYRAYRAAQDKADELTRRWSELQES